MSENRALNPRRWSKWQLGLLVGNVVLASVALAFFFSARSNFFYFDIGLRASQPGTIQLSYDAGRGIEEVTSARASFGSNQSVESFRFSLPAGEYRSVRLALIGSEDRRITLSQLRIVDWSGRVRRDFSPVLSQIGERKLGESETSLYFAKAESHPTLVITLGSPLILQPSGADIWRHAGKVFLLPSLLIFSLIGLCWTRFRPLSWTETLLLVTPLLSAFLVFVYLLTRSRYLAPLSGDEGYFIFYGWLVKNGAVPYRDFLEPKPPVIFFANALGLQLFGLKNFLFRIIPTAVAVGSVMLFLGGTIRRKISPWLSILLAAQVALWLLGDAFHDTGLNDSENYGWAFTLDGFALGSIAFSLKKGPGKVVLQVLSGVTFGLAVLSKELFVLSVIPAWLLAAWHGRGKWDWRQLWLSAVAGIAVGLLFLVYLIGHGALVPYLEAIRFSRVFAANYCFEIGQFPRVSGTAALVAGWIRLRNGLYNFNQLAFVLPLCLATILMLRSKGKRISAAVRISIAVVAVLLGMVAISIGYCFFRHYFLMGTMGVILFAVLGAEALSEFLARRKAPASLFAFISLLALFVLDAKTPVERMLAESFPASRNLPLDVQAVQTITEHSRPGDYILDTDAALLYVALERKSPVPVVGFTDEFWAAAIQADVPSLRVEALQATLEQHLPKVCYFSSIQRARQEMYHRLIFDPLLAKYHYIKLNDFLWYLPDTGAQPSPPP